MTDIEINTVTTRYNWKLFMDVKTHLNSQFM